MLELILVFIFAVFVYLGFRANLKNTDIRVFPKKVSNRLGILWDIAHEGMRQNRFLRAEKALLTILKLDSKNAPAYNRLGILYAKQKEYKDAIDCFEIASSIEPTATSLHNLGLIYYETENYQKAMQAFEMALNMEDNLAARHIAYAKVLEKLGNTKLMISELEVATKLEPNEESYSLLKRAYEDLSMFHEAKAVGIKLKRLELSKQMNRPKRILRPRRVVI
ncbi:MAG TPA: tetratricopeptide repeat protein [Candidatus Saccharimonadia bacterium]|nr:tetratricopeptide repeat protein [Candidatus Saccharimonadia bacterium]